MGQNKKHITPENITEWLSSTGFLLPRNEAELQRFEKIHGDRDFGLTGKEIDPSLIIAGRIPNNKTIQMPREEDKTKIEQYRMAARKGSSLPQHILDKIKKNQNKNKGDEPQSEKVD